MQDKIRTFNFSTVLPSKHLGQDSTTLEGEIEEYLREILSNYVRYVIKNPSVTVSNSPFIRDWAVKAAGDDQSLEKEIENDLRRFLTDFSTDLRTADFHAKSRLILSSIQNHVVRNPSFHKVE